MAKDPVWRGRPGAGVVVAVHGVVIDVDLLSGGLPSITHALVIHDRHH